MALQHLRSSTADKRPTPGAMSDGQLAMNNNLVSPGLFLKDSNGDLVKVGPVHVGTTAPNVTPGAGGQAGNSKGEQWLDTSSSRYVFKIWDGTAWRSEDGEFVNVSGDTMTGALGIIAGTAAAPGVFFSGDTNTGIYSPGADTLAFVEGGVESMRIDSSGRHLVGTSSARNVGAIDHLSQIEHQTGGSFSLTRNASASASGPIFTLAKSRGSSTGGVTAVANGDVLGRIFFAGANGTDLSNQGAEIKCEVDGDPFTSGDTTDLPGRLVFSTTADGASTPTERMRIRSDGNIGIGSTGSSDVALSVTKNADVAGFIEVRANGASTAAASTLHYKFYSIVGTTGNSGTPYTVPRIDHFNATQTALNADSTVTNQYGFRAESSLTGATTNYGFFGNIATATGRWNFYAANTAPNYFAGDVRTNTVVTTRQAPTNSNTTATVATAASLIDGLRTSTPTADITLLVPTGTSMDAALQELQTNQSFEWSLINLATAASGFDVTVTANTDHTVVGRMVVTGETSGRFLTRKTAANTFISYRIA